MLPTRVSILTFSWSQDFKHTFRIMKVIFSLTNLKTTSSSETLEWFLLFLALSSPSPPFLKKNLNHDFAITVPICHLIIWLQSEINCLTKLARKPSSRWKSSLGWTLPNRYLHQSKHSLKYASFQVCQASLKFRDALLFHHHSKLSYSKTPLYLPSKTWVHFKGVFHFWDLFVAPVEQELGNIEQLAKTSNFEIS